MKHKWIIIVAFVIISAMLAYGAVFGGSAETKVHQKGGTNGTVQLA